MKSLTTTSKNLFFLFLLATFTISSCKKDESNESPSIVGQWKLVDATDVVYLEATATTITIYDYMGDEYDAGADCYAIESSPYTIAGNIITSFGFPVIYTISENQLSISIGSEVANYVRTPFTAATFVAKDCGTGKRAKTSKTFPFTK